MNYLFNIPNLLTACNLISGVISIIFAFAGRIEWAVLAIFIGAVFDFFDGFAARMLKKQGELGKQLDSLADMVTFGVAPGILVFILLVLSGAWNSVLEQGGTIDDFWFSGTMGFSVQYWVQLYLDNLAGNGGQGAYVVFQGWTKVAPFGALLIPFMSLFRLAKFNLDERQTDSFIGLPTPANTIFFVSFGLLLWDGFGGDLWKHKVAMILISDQVLLPLVAIFSLLLVSELPLFSLKFKTFTWKENQVRFIFLLLAVALFATLFVWSIPIIVFLYLGLSFFTRIRN